LFVAFGVLLADLFVSTIAKQLAGKALCINLSHSKNNDLSALVFNAMFI